MSCILYPDSVMVNLDHNLYKTFQSVNFISNKYGWYSGVYVDKLVQYIHREGINLILGKFRNEFGTCEHHHIVKVKSIVIDNDFVSLEVDSKLMFMFDDKSYDYSTTIKNSSTSEFVDVVSKNVDKILQTVTKMKNKDDEYDTLERNFFNYFETNDGEKIIKEHAKEFLLGLSKKLLKLHKTNGPIPRGLI